MKKIALFIFLNAIVYASFSGTIIDKKTSKPIYKAMIMDSTHFVKSNKKGKFKILSSEKKYHIKAYGYRPFAFKSDSNTTIFKLEPIRVKALYLTFWGASNNSKTLKNMLKIIDNSEINSVVVDVKNEYGSTLYLTSCKKANACGAQKQRTNRNIQKFMKIMKDRKIYTIARIVAFKDEIQASHNPHYAIKNAKGKLWRNDDNMAWVDPFNKKAQNYILDIAEDAAKVGFDEINFDYIRFPAKSNLRFSKLNTQKNRIEAIGDFIDLAKKRLRKYGVFISVNIYGNVCWSKDDNNIGQTIQSLAKHADYLAPMLYPSSFASGSFNLKYPSNHPYIVVYRSIKHIRNRIDSSRVRPWIQYFKDYTKRRRHYKRFEVREQIRGADNANTNGWMVWSPSSKYQLDYFR